MAKKVPQRSLVDGLIMPRFRSAATRHDILVRKDCESASGNGNVPFVAIKKAPKFGFLVETNLTRVYIMPFDHFVI